MGTRRDFMRTGVAVASVGSAVTAVTTSPARATPRSRATALPPAAPGRDYTPVVTPNGTTLPFRVRDGVKVMHLVVRAVEHTFAPGLEATCWGYNGSTPGPTIEAVVGDRVRIYVTNRLPEATTVHWHGVILENGMDGVAGVTQPAILPGQTFKYEITLRHAGTFMYHPHFDEMTQMALGLMGMLVVHPRNRARRVDRDYAIMLSEWQVIPGTRRPNPLAMTDFNVLTMNGKAFPATTPLVAALGERVRIRFGNLGAMDHHPIHLHGYSFRVTATDGGPIPESAQHGDTSVLVPVGSTRDIELLADNPGDWPLHCHMTHHVMNQMGHEARNVIGADVGSLDARIGKVVPAYMSMGAGGMGGMAQMGMPMPENSIPMGGSDGPFGFIDMGGMFTLLKVRDVVDARTAGSWYAHPPGTVAAAATADELRADGIELDRS